MPVELLQPLRNLRKRARSLAKTIDSDHESFQVKDGEPEPYYYRLPSNPAKSGDPPSVTPTCTAWMAFCAARSLSKCFGKANSLASIERAYTTILSEPWDTGRLPQNNAFTVAVVARAAGLLMNSHPGGSLDIETIERTQENFELKYEPNKKPVLDKNQPINDNWRQCNNKPITSVLASFLENPKDSLALNPFPASPTIGYWMIDAASRLEVKFKPAAAEELAVWAGSEFRRQHSLVASRHQAMMDPVALAMSACACKALSRMADPDGGLYAALKKSLFPSDAELESGVREFFTKQNAQSGVWEKYFPIFHYPASGPNHCWHFEVLEAVISEFPALLNEENILIKLDRSLGWLESNRLHFRHEGKTYSGWNAGGDIQAMRRGEPESWPTSVAHMFLARLGDRLDECIHSTVLEKLGDRAREMPKDGGESWRKYMDSPFLKAQECGLPENRNSVQKLIEAEILAPAEGDARTNCISSHFTLSRRRSAVLFGPPGTSKTTLCKSVAKRLGWHFVELSPSDFLGGGLEGIYDKVTEIFEDLLDLYGVVILFDEMDALVQSRDANEKETPGGAIDVTQKLLTTSMLPKLQRLNEGGRAIFFMATNYIGNFDGAIIRSGRFDLLVHMGPPSTAEKCKKLAAWCRDEDEKDVGQARKAIEAALSDEDDRERFGRFTFGEAGKFFYSLVLSKDSTTTAKAISSTDKEEIKTQVRKWAKSKITLSDETKTEGALAEFESDAVRVSIQ
ncbi:MAG: hypothetical protein CMJ58_15220 [Planctomycetaceae bacterium]|nr:hypothetical protein [Planctomycetaceae bacterium]